MEPHDFERALERARTRLMVKTEPEAGPPKEEVPDPAKPRVNLGRLEEAVTPEAEESKAGKKRRITRRGVVAICAVGLFVVLLIFVILPIAQGTTRLYIVSSGSMTPAMNSGDVAVVTKVDPSEVKVGDVIAYERDEDPQTLITHRVTEVVSNGGLGFRTKGDANEKPDQYLVGASSVLGKVGLTIPKLGYVVYFLRTTFGFFFLVVLPAGLLIAFEVRKMLKHARLGHRPSGG